MTDKTFDLRGVIVATTLAFKEDPSAPGGLAVDYDRFAEHCSWLIDNGCRGVGPNGSLGEYSSLTDEERRRVIQVAVGAVGDRGLVIAAESNEISRASMGGSAAAAAGGSALTETGSFGGLLTDRAPAGSPVTGLLMRCRARLQREHLIIRLQVSPGCCDSSGYLKELQDVVHWRRLG